LLANTLRVFPLRNVIQVSSGKAIKELKKDAKRYKINVKMMPSNTKVVKLKSY